MGIGDVLPNNFTMASWGFYSEDFVHFWIVFAQGICPPWKRRVSSTSPPQRCLNTNQWVNDIHVLHIDQLQILLRSEQCLITVFERLWGEAALPKQHNEDEPAGARSKCAAPTLKSRPFTLQPCLARTTHIKWWTKQFRRRVQRAKCISHDTRRCAKRMWTCIGSCDPRPDRCLMDVSSSQSID